MSLLRSIASGLRSIFQKKRTDGELDEEVRDFLDLAAEDKLNGA